MDKKLLTCSSWQPDLDVRISSRLDRPFRWQSASGSAWRRRASPPIWKRQITLGYYFTYRRTWKLGLTTSGDSMKDFKSPFSMKGKITNGLSPSSQTTPTRAMTFWCLKSSIRVPSARNASNSSTPTSSSSVEVIHHADNANPNRSQVVWIQQYLPLNDLTATVFKFPSFIVSWPLCTLPKKPFPSLLPTYSLCRGILHMFTNATSSWSTGTCFFGESSWCMPEMVSKAPHTVISLCYGTWPWLVGGN
mgnify:CR=1 FL=1